MALPPRWRSLQYCRANPELERDTILTVVAVTTLSTIAMVLYPLFVGTLGLSHTDAGIFLGGTIHDVAQVVGAGYMVSPETGDVSTYIKLLRVAMLLPVVFLIAFIVTRSNGSGSGSKVPLPIFLFGFAALVVVNSAGYLPTLRRTILRMFPGGALSRRSPLWDENLFQGTGGRRLAAGCACRSGNGVDRAPSSGRALLCDLRPTNPGAVFAGLALVFSAQFGGGHYGAED